MMHPRVAKAWHLHATQIDWWYVPIGDLKVGLYDTRDGSPTKGELQELFLGEHYDAQLLKIPPGVAHGCRAIGTAAHLMYLTSKTYDPDHEELRILTTTHQSATTGRPCHRLTSVRQCWA